MSPNTEKGDRLTDLSLGHTQL